MNAIVDRLLQFLEMEKDYVTAEALVYNYFCSIFSFLFYIIFSVFYTCLNSMVSLKIVWLSTIYYQSY